MRMCHHNPRSVADGLLVNSSRGIIYASSGSDFADAATKAARNLQQQMQDIIDAM